MTTSILNDTLLLKDEVPERLQEYMQRINLDLFDPIFRLGPTNKEAAQKVMFILCAYSEDSPLIILRQDNKEEKEGICEYLGIPDYLRKNLMTLAEPEVRNATTQYLLRFAGPLFKALMFLKIQDEDFDLDITNRAFVITTTDTDKEGTVTVNQKFDPKEHMKAVAEREKLARKIQILENELKAQVKKMDGIEHLKEYVRASKGAGRMKGMRKGNVETAIKNN